MQAIQVSEAPPTPVPERGALSLGGLVTVKGLGQTLHERDLATRQQAEAEAQAPMVQGLAAYVRTCWEDARRAKDPVQERMLAALRARRGEYDPDVATLIKQTGGSEIYMMLFATKARQLGALLRDTVIGAGTEKPWTLSPTAEPEMPNELLQEVWQEALDKVAMAEMSGVPMAQDDVREMLRDMRDEATNEVLAEARSRCARMEIKMEDQLQEGGWTYNFDQFIDDLAVYPSAVLKGPVVRRRRVLSWQRGMGGQYELQMTDKMRLEWDRVDPMHVYPARGSTGPNDKYLIERHASMPRSEFEALIGVEGYSEAAIRAMLMEHGQDGLRDWLWSDNERLKLQGGEDSSSGKPTGIDALQFWGPVSGRMLLDWGMDEALIDDPDKEYEAEVWLVGRHVIKAVVNSDPLHRRPYYVTGFERVPGAFWHNSLFDVIKDVCAMCNSAARALSNNMGIASGPQVWVNVDRVPDGADITSMYPWKVHQVKDDLTGMNSAPIGFFQPTSNAAELMAVYEKFSVMADEHSGLPRYMTGGEGAGGAGRTASGLAMMVGNASKTIKALVSNLDTYIISPAVERLYFFNMRYLDDPELKGDVNVVARGAMSLVTKESAQVRRIEFLARTANPIDMQIIGPEGRAYVLRETARSLDLDVDRVVPTMTSKKLDLLMEGGGEGGGAPPPPEGAEAPVAGPGQALMNGQQITDHFTPQPE